jgi:hypothetical protein
MSNLSLLAEEIRSALSEGRRSAIKAIQRHTGDDMPHGLRKAPLGVSPGIPKDRPSSTVRVPIRSLLATQDDVGPSDVERHVRDPQLSTRNPRSVRSGSGDTSRPVVVKKNGNLYVADGHHRITARRLQGKKHVRVSLFDAD